MVENQHSINSILSFSAKSVEPEILERLLIGRGQAADYLTSAVDSIVNDGLNENILVVGQRGMGKTHLLRILYHRCVKYIEQDKLVVAYFSEEEYGVSNYFDFLIRIIYAFLRWNDADKDYLQEKISELQEVSSAVQPRFAEKIINDYLKDRPLLILCENFGDILNAIGPKEQGRLRAWLYQDERKSIIATSQSMSDDFEREDRPFFGFFNLYYLKTLTYKDSYDFLMSLAELDGRKDVIRHLKNRGLAQVRAIHDLVKGNHRLLVTFYEFLKSDTLAKLSRHFIKTINDLKPYYETYIRYLPPMQQKVLRYIALSRKPQQGVDVAKNCFIDQNSLSKQLSILVRNKLLEAIPDPKDGRNKLYDINEPLLRISIEVGEHKEGITALFVDFLALYYDEVELKTRIDKFNDLMQNCKNSQEKREFLYEITAIEKALDRKQMQSSKRRIDMELVTQLSKYIDAHDYANSINIISLLLATNLDDTDRGQLYRMAANLYAMEGKYHEAEDLLKELGEETIIKLGLSSTLGYAMSKAGKQTGDKRGYPEILRRFELAREMGEDLELYIIEWGGTLIDYGIEKDDQELIDEGLKMLRIEQEKHPDSETASLELGYFYLSLALFREDDELVIAGFESFALAAKINPKNSRVFDFWGGGIGLLVDALKVSNSVVEDFKNAFVAIEYEDRLDNWSHFARMSQPMLMKYCKTILLDDIARDPGAIATTLVEWIINILSYRKIHSVEKLNMIRDITTEAKALIPELEIMESYVNVYQKYLIEGDKNSILELSKEQREFFNEKILKGLPEFSK